MGAAARVDRVDDLDRAILAVGDRIGRRGRKGVAERGELVDERRGLPVFLVECSFCAGNPEEQLCLISHKTVPDFVL